MTLREPAQQAVAKLGTEAYVHKNSQIALARNDWVWVRFLYNFLGSGGLYLAKSAGPSAKPTTAAAILAWFST